MIAWLRYGWDIFSEMRRIIHAGVFAIAGVIWVYFYMVLLAFMNYPYGLDSYDPIIVMDVPKLFVNPTVWSLMATIVFGALVVTMFILVLVYFRFCR